VGRAGRIVLDIRSSQAESIEAMATESDGDLVIAAAVNLAHDVGFASPHIALLRLKAR
jgi:hypothetical protein